MKSEEFVRLGFSVIICLLAGFIGSAFTSQSINNWYLTLEKPSFNPPNWVFGPVWTVLYLMMAVSLYIIWNQDAAFINSKLQAFFFAAQLFLNTLWSVVFFRFRDISLGLFVILGLWIAILATILSFRQKSYKAALLLIPYLLWVGFAAILNYKILVLNP